MTITADLKDCSYKNICSKSREKLKLDCSHCVVAKCAVGNHKLVGGNIGQSPCYFIENLSVSYTP